MIFSVSVMAFIASSRNIVNQLPRSSFVPLFVTMFITPPLLRPYSAFDREVTKPNSWIASSGNICSRPPTVSSLLSPPSIW